MLTGHRKGLILDGTIVGSDRWVERNLAGYQPLHIFKSQDISENTIKHIPQEMSNQRIHCIAVNERCNKGQPWTAILESSWVEVGGLPTNLLQTRVCGWFEVVKEGIERV